MPKIRVKNAIQFFDLGRDIIQKTKKDVLSIVASDATEQIKKNSDGELDPKTLYGPDMITLAVEKDKNDPEGSKAVEIEKRSHAFSDVYDKIKDKSYVINLINRKRK